MSFHAISVFQLYVWVKIKAALISFSVSSKQSIKRGLQLDLGPDVKTCSTFLNKILLCFFEYFFSYQSNNVSILPAKF